MEYARAMSSSSPGSITIAIDQSGSMAGRFGGESDKPKHTESARAANYILAESVNRCTVRTENETFIKDRFDFSVVGYGSEVKSLLDGIFSTPYVKPSDLAKSCLRIEKNIETIDDEEGGQILEEYESPVWVDPRAGGLTPMAEAFDLITSLIEKWVKLHPESFPPVVINITDGEPNDMLQAQMSAAKLRSIKTCDGSTLLFNIHISSNTAPQVVLPCEEAELPHGDNFAKFLFGISSPLPEKMLERAKMAGYEVKTGARAFVYNADPTTLVEILEIGSQL